MELEESILITRTYYMWNPLCSVNSFDFLHFTSKSFPSDYERVQVWMER